MLGSCGDVLAKKGKNCQIVALLGATSKLYPQQPKPLTDFDFGQNDVFCNKINAHMATEKMLERIEINPKVLSGKPVIKGTRLSVQFIVGLLGQGVTMEEILQEYHRLSKEDILACLIFASKTLESNSFFPLPQAA